MKEKDRMKSVIRDIVCWRCKAGFKFDSIKKCSLILQHWRVSPTTDIQTSGTLEDLSPNVETTYIMQAHISAMNLFLYIYKIYTILFPFVYSRPQLITSFTTSFIRSFHWLFRSIFFRCVGVENPALETYNSIPFEKAFGFGASNLIVCRLPNDKSEVKCEQKNVANESRTKRNASQHLPTT